jgi:hypothetical protein
LSNGAAFKSYLEGDALRLGSRLAVRFHKTLRVPDDDKSYPLPPTFGPFRLYRAADYQGRVPESWVVEDALFFPMYQREAMWLGFLAVWWKPNALMIGADGVNVVSGEAWEASLSAEPQNYLVAPDQPWLDGIKTQAETVRQFVAVALGAGYTIGEQLRPGAATQGVQFRVYEPRPGLFPDSEPEPQGGVLSTGMRSPAMGIGAGGAIRQKIVQDRYGVGTWDLAKPATAIVYIVNGELFESLTGEPPPPTPISAEEYTRRGFPWFDLYEESSGIAAPGLLQGVKSVSEIDSARFPGKAPENSVDITAAQVRKIRRRKKHS